MKKNIGATLALYPAPVIVVGAMVDGKPNWTLVAHAGTVAHSHLMVSMVQAHYTNKGIRENSLQGGRRKKKKPEIKCLLSLSTQCSLKSVKRHFQWVQNWQNKKYVFLNFKFKNI